MRVLLSLNKFDFGGTENHVCDLANTLTEFGHEVFIIAGKGRQVLRLNSKVTFINYKLSDFLFPVNIFFICYIIKKYRIDVIHAHQRRAIFYCTVAKKLTKKPLIVTVHGRTRLDLRSSFTRNGADRIIFVSNHVLRVSSCYEQIKNKSVVIPNGVEVIQGSNATIPYSISYVSRVDHKHSLVILMMIQEVLPVLSNEFPNITFNIIGEGRGLKDIKDESEKLNAKFNRSICNVLGFQPEVKEIFRKSALVLGVGRVALEALACGVPVISINQKRLGSLITSHNFKAYKDQNFIAVKNNSITSNELISIITDFFRNSSDGLHEAQKLQKLIKAEFDISILAQRIETTYSEEINSYS